MKKVYENVMLVFVTLLMFQNAYSQRNYLPGQIFKLNGNTINGFIDCRNWDKNPDQINFKERITDIGSITFKPSEVNGFSVNDEYYESAAVKEETSLTTTYDEQLNLITDTVFLQVMYKGFKSLYYLKNKNGKELFYIKRDNFFDLLVYKTYYKNGNTGNVDLQNTTTANQYTNGSKILVENEKFRGQLLSYLQDCPNIQSRLNQTKYRKESLDKLFEYYYRTTAIPIEFQKKTEKIKAALGLLTGTAFSSIKFNDSDSHLNLVNSDFSTSTDFTAGVYCEFVFPRNQGKWTAPNELIYTSYCFDSSVDEGLFTYHYRLGYSYIKLNNLIRYNYQVGKLLLFANAGISNGFTIKETNYSRRESDINVYDPEKAIGETRKYEQGYLLGVGAKLKKVLIEYRIEKGNGMSAYSFLKSSTTRQYFILGYRF